jgi:hypothetical protein
MTKPDTRPHRSSPVLIGPKTTVTPVRPAPYVIGADGGTGVTGKALCESPAKPGRVKPVRYALTLQALPDVAGVPPIIRLRRFLKAALRSYGLKCTRCEPADGSQ